MDRYLIPAAIAVLIVFLLWLIWKIYSRIIAGKILENGRGKKNFAYNYLSVRFSRINTMKDVRLPVDTAKGKIMAEVGTVYVNRGGIFVINTVRGSGYVENYYNGVWCRTMNDVQYRFNDPFVENLPRVKAMKVFLRGERISNIPIHNIVLFTGEKIKFARHMNGLITADELTAFMKDLNKDRFLTKSEIKMVVKTIKKKTTRKV